MEIPIRLQILCTISLLLSVVRWGDAQFYGSYGRAAYFAPITFPQPPDNDQNIVPVISRVSDDFGQPQPQPQPEILAANLAASQQISKGSEQFAFEMFSVSAFCAKIPKSQFFKQQSFIFVTVFLASFQTIANALQQYDANFIISPFSVWSLMLLIAEGATDESFQQLQNVLRLPNNFSNLRQAYKQFQRLLLVNTTTVQLAVNQALFSDLNRPVENDYAVTLSYEYEADHIPINFQNPALAVQQINGHISYRTQGKIRDVIKPEDLLETQLLLISSIFFKGKWKVSYFYE